MAKPDLSQDYFTASDIEEIINRLMNFRLAGGMFSDKKVAATQALNVIRILKDRLSAGRSVLELIYTDEAIVPRPLARFMRDYLNGRYKQEEAEQMLEGLQADMRQNYFQRKILFDDASKLPRSKVFDPTGDFTKEIKKLLKLLLQNTIQKSIVNLKQRKSINKLVITQPVN